MELKGSLNINQALSANTIYSGTTDLGDIIISSLSGFSTIITSATLNNLSVSGNTYLNILTATTVSGGTIYSGSTNLYDIFSPIGGGSSTFVQNGINTFTGGTSLNPTINITSATLENIIISGTSIFNEFSATALSADTLISPSISGTSISATTLYIRNASSNVYGNGIFSSANGAIRVGGGSFNIIDIPGTSTSNTTRVSTLTADRSNYSSAGLGASFNLIGGTAGSSSASSYAGLSLTTRIQQSNQGVNSGFTAGIFLNPTLTSVYSYFYNLRLVATATTVGGGAIYNIFADGSAPNYMFGKTMIGDGQITGTTTSQLFIQPTITSVVGQTIKGSVGQTADLLQVTNNGNTSYFRVDANGNVIVSGSTSVGLYISNNGSTPALALSSNSSGRLTIGNGFTSLLIPSAIRLSSGGDISNTGSRLNLNGPVGGGSNTNYTSIFLGVGSGNGSLNPVSGTVKFVRMGDGSVNNDWNPVTGNANFIGFSMELPIASTSAATGSVTLIDLNPAQTSLGSGSTVYGLRSRINNSSWASAGTVYNIYIDGTASNYLKGSNVLGDSSNSGNTTSQLFIQPISTSIIGHTIKANVGQTADLLQIQDNSGGNLVKITSAGTMLLSGATSVINIKNNSAALFPYQLSLSNTATTYYLGTDPTTNTAGVANAFWIGATPTTSLVYLTSTIFSTRPTVTLQSGGGLFTGKAGAQGAAGTNYDAIQLNNSTSAIPQPTSGTFNAIAIGAGTNTQFAPNSGNGNYVAISIRTGYQQSSGTTGNIWGVRYNPNILSSVTGNHNAWENTTGNMLFGTTSGLVGIGKSISSPSAQLEIRTTSATTGLIVSGASGQQNDLIQVKNSSGNNLFTLTTGATIYMATGSTTPTTPVGGGIMWVDNTGALMYISPSGTISTIGAA